MDRPKNRFAELLKLSVLVLLLLGSCAGPMVMYSESPRWLLAPVEKVDDLSFFVAARPKDAKSTDAFKVIRYMPETNSARYANLNFHLPGGRLTERSGGDGSAKGSVKAAPQGGQLVQILVVGDAPWTSLSEYRVRDNRIELLRHAHSSGWILLGCLLALVPLHVLMKKLT